jgi:hypothetical protein
MCDAVDVLMSSGPAMQLENVLSESGGSSMAIPWKKLPHIVLQLSLLPGDPILAVTAVPA